uniref:Uncharacterized protein n=1 Tax=Arundo donax TaxID=35708 RepID=A0A0A9U035_ARUDO
MYSPVRAYAPAQHFENRVNK